MKLMRTLPRSFCLRAAARGRLRGRGPENRLSTAPVKEYALKGEIVSLVPQGQAANIKHEKIDGWMEAMTMEFPVKDKSEFDSLRVGDRITATVFVQDSGLLDRPHPSQDRAVTR